MFTTLACLLVFPFVVSSWMERLRREISDVASPMRSRLRDLTEQVSLEVTTFRLFVHTGDPVYRQRYVTARANEAKMLEEIHRAAKRLGNGAAEESARPSSVGT